MAPLSTTSSDDPTCCGYFRTFEWRRLPELPDNEIRGYHKPIMIAGGVGNVRTEHANKIDVPGRSQGRHDRRSRHVDRPGRRRGVESCEWYVE